jgi:exosortase
MSTVAAPLETPLPRSEPIVSWRPALGMVVMAMAHIPILWRYLTGVVELPHYEFVFLLPVGAAVLAVPRCRQLGNLTPGRAFPFLCWIFGAILAFAASVVLESPWFGAISALLAAAGTSYAVGGRRLSMAIMPAWVLLWLGIRLPLTYDERLAQSLQTIAAQRASSVMNYFNVEHILDGNVVETAPLDGKENRYMVEEACSGVQSLFAITACTLWFALWMREPIGRIVLLMAVGWWWVWVANVVRVIAVTVLNSQWGLPVDKGWGHTALSIFLFAVTLGLIVSSEHLLLFLLPRGIFASRDRINTGVAKPLPDYGPTHVAPLSQSVLASPLLIGGYLALFTLQWLPQVNVPRPSATPVRLGTINLALAPSELAGWKLRGGEGGFTSEQRRADSQWGAHSQTWRYVKGPRELIVSVDYPFRGWHELTTCYRADGWKLDTRHVIEVPRNEASADVIAAGERCVEAVFQRPEVGNYSYLLFTTFNDQQQPLPAEQLNAIQKLVDRVTSFGERLRTLGASGSGRNDQVQSFQLQVLLQGAAPPTEDDRREAMAMFVEFRSRLGRFLSSEAAAGGGQ